MIYDAIVIGGGPAGLTAALYLKRFRRKVLVIDRGGPRVLMAPKIRNLVGYFNGISGRELLARLRAQVVKHKVRVARGEARVFERKTGFIVRVGSRSLMAKNVILATGMKDIQPPVSNFKDLCRRFLVAYCPVCDAYEHREQDIGVFVQSPESLGKIRFMTTYSRRLHVFTPKKLKWPKKARDFFQRKGITLHIGEVERLQPTKSNKAVTVFLRTGPRVTVNLLYIELGATVPAEAIKPLRSVARTTRGFIQVNSHQETSVPGLYAVGDCVEGLSQVSVAVGHAAIAATRIHNQLLASEE